MPISTANTLIALATLFAFSIVLSLYVLSKPVAPTTGFADVGGEVFKVEILASAAGRYHGMSGRETLPANRGMLFVYPDEQLRDFCMRGCLIDIDILFLNRAGEIVALHEMKCEIPDDPQRLYSSDKPAMYALELQAGTIQRLNLQPGMSVLLRDVPPPHTAEYE